MLFIEKYIFLNKKHREIFLFIHCTYTPSAHFYLYILSSGPCFHISKCSQIAKYSKYVFWVHDFVRAFYQKLKRHKLTHSTQFTSTFHSTIHLRLYEQIEIQPSTDMLFDIVNTTVNAQCSATMKNNKAIETGIQQLQLYGEAPRMTVHAVLSETPRMRCVSHYYACAASRRRRRRLL